MYTHAFEPVCTCVEELERNCVGGVCVMIELNVSSPSLDSKPACSLCKLLLMSVVIRGYCEELDMLLRIQYNPSRSLGMSVGKQCIVTVLPW